MIENKPINGYIINKDNEIVAIIRDIESKIDKEGKFISAKIKALEYTNKTRWANIGMELSGNEKKSLSDLGLKILLFQEFESDWPAVSLVSSFPELIENVSIEYSSAKQCEEIFK